MYDPEKITPDVAAMFNRHDTSAPTAPLDEFLLAYRQSDSYWWQLDSGHMQNLFEEACERIAELEEKLDALSNMQLTDGDAG